MSTFNEAVSTLAIADLEAKRAAGDATQARGEKSTAAVDLIKVAHSDGIEPDEVKTALENAGVLKGTVSKVLTILKALNSSLLHIGDVRSLSGAYTTVKMIESLAATTAVAAAEAAAIPFAAPAPAVVATTPNEALEIILDSIKSITDPDQAFKAGGEWITKITNAITDALASIGDEDDE